MSFIKNASAILSAITTTVVLSIITADKAQALSEIGLPEQFVIENASNRNFVVDKFGDDPNLAAKAHLYTKTDSRTHTLRGIRSGNGSYEVKLAYNSSLCFTMAGGLNPNQGNGTLATFSGDCNNSLNLRFFDDGTVRVARNTTLCLTNQGNRHSTPFNKLHFWACDGSAETKWNIAAASGQSVTYNPPVVTQQYNPKPQVNTAPQSIVPNFGPTNSGALPDGGQNKSTMQTMFGLANSLAKDYSDCSGINTEPSAQSENHSSKIQVKSLHQKLLIGVCILAKPGGTFSSQSNLMPVYHVYPNALPVSWEQASNHCVATYSKAHRPTWLIWNQDLKKCVGHG
jgi:hypothetical protein